MRRFTDPRIRFLTQTNRGLAATLNRGIQHAQARYIARQDQDDVSWPKRIGKQVAFLDAHPDCALVGTWAQIWKGRTPTERIHAHPSENAQLKFELLLNNPFVHSSAMIRKEALDCVKKRIRGSAKRRIISGVSSLEPSSIIINSKSVNVCPSVLSICRRGH